MSVFGEILFLSNVSGTIVFVAVMIFLTIFEALLHTIEIECSKRGYKGLIKKLYREFMIMGFISFAILLGTESSSSVFSTSNQWYQSFHLAHIVILFIGITFLCQAILLVSLISFRNKTLLSYGDSNPEKLALEYINLHNEGGIMQWFFDHGLITIPFPRLRERIEYKMLQEFFINFYNLPREFKFANYMSQALKDYIVSLVEVRPITWIILVALIALNYVRIIWIDPYYQHDVCERYPAKNLNYGVAHRLLAGGGGGDQEAHYDDQHAYEVCNEYTLRYVFFCSMTIVLYLLGVFTASEIYLQRLIDKVLDVEETIEKEEDRIAAEEMPLYDADDLLDHEGDHPQTHTTPATPAGTTRPPSLRRQVSAGSTGSSSNNHPGGFIRRTASHQSLDSQPSQPGLDVEHGHSHKSGAGGRSSIASTHRGSFALPFLGMVYEEGEHGQQGHHYSGVAQALQGIIMGKNRRHLYLHCIQRMIQTEEEVTRKEARRLSIASEDGHHHHPNHGNHNNASTNRHSLQSLNSAQSQTRARAATTHISEIYDQHFRHNYHHHNNSNNNNHNHHQNGEEMYTSPTPSIPHITFREVNPLSPQSAAGGRNRAVSGAAQHHPFSATAGDGNSNTAGGGGGGGLRALIDRTFHMQNSTNNINNNNSPLPAHHHQPPQARARAYSAQYFEIEQSPVRQLKAEALLQQESLSGRTAAFCTSVFHLLRTIVFMVGQLVLDVLLGNHVGHAHDHVQLDKDIKHRLRAFRSIFLWERPGLYYFAVEFSLLIQCFYMALWATNFVVIARDSYFPVLWEIALVVPLPINFFLLKQIIYTSCMVKSIVQMDQRTANRIIEQAIDERNVTQRLRRIVRDTMKEWDIPRRDWPLKLQTYFDLYANEDDEHSIDPENFKAFLHEIKIFITDESLRNLFKVIDADRDKRISWSMLSKIIFPDHKKQKKVKLRKRKVSEGGRFAYEYVVSEEAKKEMEKTNERRGSVLSMLTRVSASTAEGAINVVRSNSLTRMSMIAMLGSQPPQPAGATAGETAAAGESKLDKLFPKIVTSTTSSPERAQAIKKKTVSIQDENSDSKNATAAVSSSHLHIDVGDEDPENEEDDEEDDEDDEDDFDSNDSTSGDEEDGDGDHSDDGNSDMGGSYDDDHAADHDHVEVTAAAKEGNVLPPTTTEEMHDGSGYHYGRSTAENNAKNGSAIDNDRIVHSEGVTGADINHQKSLASSSSRAFPDTDAGNNKDTTMSSATAAAAAATTAPDVISFGKKLTNLRISARNLFDI